MRGLASAFGGSRADELVPEINRIARERALGEAGRNQLIESVTRVGRAEPDLTNDQLVGRAGVLGAFGQATGLGGGEAFNVLQSIRTTRGVSFERAGDIGAALIGAGFDEGMIQDITQEGANVGLSGKRTLPLLYAARGRISLVDSLGENLNTFAEQLARTGESGGLAQGLRDLGLTGEMDFVAKLAKLREGVESGRITRGQIAAQTGEIEVARVFDPLSASLGDLPAAERALAEFRVEDAIERQGESEAVRAMWRARRREVREVVASENFGGSGGAEFFEESKTRLAEQGGGSVLLGGARRVLTTASSNPAVDELFRLLDSDGLYGGAGGGADGHGITIIDNRKVTNVGRQYNNRRDPAVEIPGSGRSDSP